MTQTLWVWAPGRSRVDLAIAGRRVPMNRLERGWWTASDNAIVAGARYGFSLDGGEVRPDPRSACQPDGVLGLSAIVDHSSYTWTDSAWGGKSLPGSLLYEVHVGTFTPAGTFDGVIERLPYLVELGVDSIELMPVAEFSGEHGWGYDGVDLYAPHHAYGGPDGLKRLVDACHAHGLGIVLDVVYNHLGPVGNFLAEFGPYFSDLHTTAWGPALNFDGPGSDDVRRFVIGNALMWIRDYHVDGLRLDAVHAIVDESPLHVLEQLSLEVEQLGDKLGRHASLIAESDANDPRLVRDRDAGGYGLDAVWADDWHHALHTVLTGESAGYYQDFGSLEMLGKALRQAWVYDGVWSTHRQKTRGRPAGGVAKHSFVVATQNHDQVGNRATGDRLAALADEGGLKIASALLLASPFTPILFQGEEWAASTPFLYFSDHSDRTVGEAVRDGRRREFAGFGWDPSRIPDPQDPSTFQRSQLNWDELEEPFHSRMLEWYRGMISLRRRMKVSDEARVEVLEEQRIIVFKRGGITVAVNLGQADWQFPISDTTNLVMASDAAIKPRDGKLCLPPLSVAVVED